jgi:hypothetical protein
VTNLVLNGSSLIHSPNSRLALAGATITMTGGNIAVTNTGASTQLLATNNASITTLASASSSVIQAPNLVVGQSNLILTVADGPAADDLVLNAPLTEHVSLPGVSITKAGPGRMVMNYSGPYNGFAAYSGPTIINGGTLALGFNSLGSSAISIANGATLDVTAPGQLILGSGQTLSGDGTILGSVAANGTVTPGLSIGALSFTGDLVMGSGNTCVFEINRGQSPSNDVINASSVTFDGTLTVTNIGNAISPGDSFQLFNASTYLGTFAATNLPPLGAGLNWQWTPTNGTLYVVSTVNTAPTNLVTVLSGNTYSISWPADHTGWRLEVQTNSLNVGLGQNWFTWPGSAATNAVSVPIDPANPAVFFRLVHP